MNIDSDDNLIKRICENDQQAYEELVNKYINRAISFSQRMLNNRQAAEDVAQEAFLKVWEVADRWRPEAKFSAWFHTVLYNLCIDKIRLDNKYNIVESEEKIETLLINQEDRYNKHQMKNFIAEAIARLPERQRAALILFYYQDLSLYESAEVLNLNANAFDSLLFRARKNLSKLLTGSKNLFQSG